MSENKLTIKEISPYLPYGLKYRLYGNFPIKEGIENIIYDIREISYKDFTLEKVLTWGSCKPLLRPLSDLTKEITVNGETFVPIEYFEIGDDFPVGIEYDIGNIKLIKDLESISKHEVNHDITWLPFGVVQKFFEWHFDVFGLIEKGLAINLNSIEPKTP